jgi:transcriptional regulator with XRE-family HTH domain
MHPYSARPVVVAAPLFRARLEKAMAGVSIRKLADRSGVNKDTINEWRTGAERPVHVEAVRKVAAALGTTAEHLLDLPVDLEAGPADESRPAAWFPAIDRAEELLAQLAVALDEARHPGSSE